MKNLLKSIFFFGIIILAFSCGDDNGGIEITIHSPEDNSTFNMGDTIILSYTVTDDVDITTIAWDTNNQFGTGSVSGSELSGDITEYSGEFVIVADVEPGTYEISVNATDEGITNVHEEIINVIIQ